MRVWGERGNSFFDACKLWEKGKSRTSGWGGYELDQNNNGKRKRRGNHHLPQLKSLYYLKFNKVSGREGHQQRKSRKRVPRVPPRSRKARGTDQGEGCHYDVD